MEWITAPVPTYLAIGPLGPNLADFKMVDLRLIIDDDEMDKATPTVLINAQFWA